MATAMEAVAGPLPFFMVSAYPEAASGLTQQRRPEAHRPGRHCFQTRRDLFFRRRGGLDCIIEGNAEVDVDIRDILEGQPIAFHVPPRGNSELLQRTV